MFVARRIGGAGIEAPHMKRDLSKGRLKFCAQHGVQTKPLPSKTALAYLPACVNGAMTTDAPGPDTLRDGGTRFISPASLGRGFVSPSRAYNNSQSSGQPLLENTDGRIARRNEPIRSLPPNLAALKPSLGNPD